MQLAARTLDHIEKLITTADTETKSRTSVSQQKVNKKVEKEDKKETPLKESQNNTPSFSPCQKQHKNVAGYHPLEKQNKLVERQVKAIYDEMDRQCRLQVQNQHSIFLNSKNPKLPIHERVQLILQEREQLLQEKRKELQRLKQQKDQQQNQKYLAEAQPKKVISKTEAQELSERLYKEYYSKLNRLNHEKVQRLKKESEIVREKPEINETSRELYRALQEKGNLEKDILGRFEKYTKKKAEKEVEMKKTHREKYFPFKPVINQTSKMLTSVRTDRGSVSQRKHCKSCVRLKTQKSHLNVTHSPCKFSGKKTFQKNPP